MHHNAEQRFYVNFGLTVIELEIKFPSSHLFSVLLLFSLGANVVPCEVRAESKHLV